MISLMPSGMIQKPARNAGRRLLNSSRHAQRLGCVCSTLDVRCLRNDADDERLVRSNTSKRSGQWSTTEIRLLNESSKKTPPRLLIFGRKEARMTDDSMDASTWS